MALPRFDARMVYHTVVRRAVTAAMGAGYPLGEIAAAEARGQDEVRHELRGEALKRVERSGRHAREAQADHHRAIARAVRLGLSTREIAVAAQVTHSTIRSINNHCLKNNPTTERQMNSHQSTLTNRHRRNEIIRHQRTMDCLHACSDRRITYRSGIPKRGRSSAASSEARSPGALLVPHRVSKEACGAHTRLSRIGSSTSD